MSKPGCCLPCQKLKYRWIFTKKYFCGWFTVSRTKLGSQDTCATDTLTACMAPALRHLNASLLFYSSLSPLQSRVILQGSSSKTPPKPEKNRSTSYAQHPKSDCSSHRRAGCFWEPCPDWEFEQFGSGSGDYKTENPPESIAQIFSAPGTAGQKSKFCVPIHSNLMRAQALPSQKWAQLSSDVTEASSSTGQPWCSLEL